jgi:hypothetical protein
VSRDLLDGLRSCISVLRYDEEPSLRWSIDNIDDDIRVFFGYYLEIVSEPVLFSIESVWWMEIDYCDSEIRGKCENLITLFPVESSLWSGHTDDMDT